MRQLQAQLVLMLAVGERQLDVGKRVLLQLVSPMEKKKVIVLHLLSLSHDFRKQFGSV